VSSAPGLVELPRPENTGRDYFDLSAALAALDTGAPLVLPPMQVTLCEIGGKPLRFCTNYDRDPIQRDHRSGTFFEARDLARLARHLPPHPRVLDVGANVGNHALFFATQCDAARVVVVEPNPLALAALVANVALNGLRDVISLDALGVGLGAASESGLFMKRHDRNLGATRMVRGQGGALEVHPGDALFADETFDLIKIDVEGMELEVLAGLQETVARCRPMLFVEVDPVNADGFIHWCATQSYETRFAIDHGGNMNYLIQPIGEKT
jgi:FkbM family methyltransferase